MKRLPQVRESGSPANDFCSLGWDAHLGSFWSMILSEAEKFCFFSTL